jgi:threonine/homoserine/homoserine lactone efflux protein
MPLELWLAYVATSAVVLAIPGPTILLVLSYSMTHGRKATFPLVAGVALGDSVAITLSLIGLGTLLATSALWFTIIKWLGGLYLIYLGLKLLRGAGHPLQLQTGQRQESSVGKLFGSAFIVTALNPKSIVFFIALLPQFISAAHPVVPQLWMLGVTFVVLATIGASSYALFAVSIRRFLTSRRAQKAYSRLGGGLLCGAGVWALSAKPVISNA